MLSIISKNGEDELMLQDIPNYKLSQNYIWYGEFDVNIDGKTYHFTGSMKYTPNETFWLELLVSPDCDLTDKFMNNPFLLSGKEIIIIAAGGLYKEYKDQKLGKNTISESIADLKADAYGIYKGIFNSKGNCDELVQEKYKKHFGK